MECSGSRTLKAVQFGAGNIGRGFLGQLYYESGYETTFVDVDVQLIRTINARGSYPLRIEDDETYTVTIGNVRALHAEQTEEVAAALAAADLASTAVGVSVLPKIAPLIAAGIRQRIARSDALPLNIIVCENMIDGGPYLREQVRPYLPPHLHSAFDLKIGFVEASIGRMVPVMTDEQKREDPLLVRVEAYGELPVDKAGIKGPIPPLINMQPQDNFGAYVERKLFVHNAGHAATAYLGYLRGHRFIWQAIRDPRVRSEVELALAESSEALVRKHGLDRAELDLHTADLLRRFANSALGDQVDRVARDPVRKLGPRDRLIGAAQLCVEQGVRPAHLAFAAAAAMRYDHPQDAAAQVIKAVYRRDGVRGVCREVCRLSEESPLIPLIEDGAKRLDKEGWKVDCGA